MDIMGPVLTVGHLAVLLICVAAYYQLAEEERIAGWIWAGASAGTYLLSWRWLHCGFGGNLLGQGALLILIGVVRAALELLQRRK